MHPTEQLARLSFLLVLSDRLHRTKGESPGLVMNSVKPLGTKLVCVLRDSSTQEAYVRRYSDHLVDSIKLAQLNLHVVRQMNTELVNVVGDI